jgi:hypothetical protein
LEIIASSMYRSEQSELALDECGEVPAVVRRREDGVPRLVVIPPVGLEVPAHVTEDLGVWLVPEPRETLVLVVDHAVGTVGDCLLGQVVDAVADEHRDDLLGVALLVAAVGGRLLGLGLVWVAVVLVHQRPGVAEHLLGGGR